MGKTVVMKTVVMRHPRGDPRPVETPEQPARSDPADGCVFCGILAGEVESSLVYEDEHVVAFMDITPVTPGHLLVVPRTHWPHLEDLDEDAGAHLFRVAHRLARAVRRSGLRCDGVNLLLADGEAAFQEVFHVHLHVLPRFAGDSFRIDADWRTADRGELEAAAAKVRTGLRRLGDERPRAGSESPGASGSTR